MASLFAIATSASANVTFQDQQVQTIDDATYQNQYVTVTNDSAFYFQSGAVAFALTMHSGWLEFSGTLQQNLILYGTTEANLTGGTVTYAVYAYNQRTNWSGGSFGGPLHVRGTAEVRIHGSGFELDGQPVAYGVLPGTQGHLTGTLFSGEPLAIDVNHGDPMGENSGTVLLVAGPPSPSPPPDVSDQIALFNDGGDYVIDHADFIDLPYGVSVRSPGATTRVSIVEGARIGHRLNFSGPSEITMTGGEVALEVPNYTNGMNGFDGSFSMSGGLFDGWAILRRGVFELSGGTVGGEVEAEQGTRLEISGGLVEGPVTCHFMDQDDVPSTFDLTGGTIEGDVRIWNDCLATWSGGEVLGDIRVAYGDLEIRGSDFAIDGVPVPYGALSATTGTLSGVLESGQPFSNSFMQSDPGTGSMLTLSVPAPSSAAGELVALVSLSAVARRLRSPKRGD